MHGCDRGFEETGLNEDHKQQTDVAVGTATRVDGFLEGRWLQKPRSLENRGASLVRWSGIASVCLDWPALVVTRNVPPARRPVVNGSCVLGINREVVCGWRRGHRRRLFGHLTRTRRSAVPPVLLWSPLISMRITGHLGCAATIDAELPPNRRFDRSVHPRLTGSCASIQSIERFPAWLEAGGSGLTRTLLNSCTRCLLRYRPCPAFLLPATETWSASSSRRKPRRPYASELEAK